MSLFDPNKLNDDNDADYVYQRTDGEGYIIPADKDGIANTGRHQNLKELRDNHREIARLKLRCVEHKEIARYMGITEASVNLVCNSPLFQQHLANLQNDADAGAQTDRSAYLDEVSILSQRALDIMDEILKQRPLTDREARLRFDAAKDILDRAGVTSPKKADVTVHNKTGNLRELDSVYADIMREAGILDCPTEIN